MSAGQVVAASEAASLPALVDRAAKTLAGAKNAAEVLEARDMAALAYDAAKRAARFAKAKGAHDELLSKVHRAQADALEIEAGAKRKLADEYDAAQERGEVAAGRPKTLPDGNTSATTAEIGLSSKDIHEARGIRDAEEEEPGIVKRTLDEAIAAGEEPTRAKVKRATRAKTKPKRKTKSKSKPAMPIESQHDRDLQMLLGVWESACESARVAFLETVRT
ncbi:MAG: hypothetical protein KF723_22390 [Rhizobiaceae bacterium]|nr:hypothetical protein [Rhizobiaceae bacterium]